MMGLNSDIVYGIVDFPYDIFDISSITASQRDALGVVLGCWDMGDNSYRMTSQLVDDLSWLRAGDARDLLRKTPTPLEQCLINIYGLEIDQIYSYYHEKLPSDHLICGEWRYDNLEELSLIHDDLMFDSGLLSISLKTDGLITRFFSLREDFFSSILSLYHEQGGDSDSFVDFMAQQLDRASLSRQCESFLDAIKYVQSQYINGYNQYSIVLSLLYDIVSFYVIGLNDPDMFLPHDEDVSLDGYCDGDDDWDDEE